MHNLIARRKRMLRENLKKEKKEFKLSGKTKSIDLVFIFSDRKNNILTKEIVFKNLQIDTALIRELLTSFHLVYAKSSNDIFMAKFNIKLFSKKEVEDYPFDRNNDVAYLHFLKYSKDYYKTNSDAIKVKPEKLIESIK